MNLKAYNIMYNLTPEDVAEIYEEKKERPLQFWTMAHKLLEMFNEKRNTPGDSRPIPGRVRHHQQIPQGRLSTDDHRTEKGSRRDNQQVDEWARRKTLNKAEYTLDKLRKHTTEQKNTARSKQRPQSHELKQETSSYEIAETWESDSVLKVAVMNKDRDMAGKYSTETRIEAKYKGKKLGAKPDRIVFRSNKTPEMRMTVEDMDKLMEWLTREQRVTMVKNQEIRCMIRDYKTEWQAIELYNWIKGSETANTGLSSPMAFYYLIVWIKYGVESQVTLDVIENQNHSSPTHSASQKRSWKTKYMRSPKQWTQSWKQK